MTGIGLGLTLSIPMVYIVEIASLEYRGILGVIPLLLVKVGILMTYVLGTTLDWKWLALTRGFNTKIPTTTRNSTKICFEIYALNPEISLKRFLIQMIIFSKLNR